MHPARKRGVHTLAIIRCARATCIVHILCMPLAIMLPNRLCRLDMMSKMTTNDTMQKTTTTMNDASECVLIAPAASHMPSDMRKHAAE